MRDEDLISMSNNYQQEATQAKSDRMQKNKLNFDMYNLNQDFDYKVEGQSREFIPKLAMAVEQNANFLQQGLVDVDDWFSVEPEEGIKEDLMRIKPEEVRRLLKRSLDQCGFTTQVNDFVKMGQIGALMIAKVRGQYVPKYKYKVKENLKEGKFSKQLIRQEDKVWQLKIDMIRHEDFLPDPSGRDLYVGEIMYMDIHEVEKLSKGKDAIYDPKVVKQLKSAQNNEGQDSQYKKARETGQNVAPDGYRNIVKLTEWWGNLIDSDGTLVAENVVWTIANDRFVIQKPTENPLWSQEHPYVAAPLLSTPKAVWPKAIMDAPATLNRAYNEFFNLMLDGGLMSVHGIKQIKEHYLADPSQVEEGIAPGTTLKVKSNCPPGEQVLSRVDTSTIPSDSFNVMNLLGQEFNVSSISNDLRFGVASFRAVKATEVVESSNAITSMLTGIAKNTEINFITEVLRKAWMMNAQHTKDIDPAKLASLFGQERANELLGMSNEELFAETVQGCKFRVFGISAMLAKQKDIVKYQTMFQMISASPVLLEEYIKEGYSLGALLTESLKALDINTSKLKSKDAPQPADPMQASQGGPDLMSQVTQAGAAGNQIVDEVQAAIPRANFPPSRATPAGG